MVQTVVQIGNSEGVTIPSEMRKKLGFKKGSKIVVKLGEDEQSVVLRKLGKKVKTSSITPEFLDWLDSFNKEYGPALEELAKK